MEKGNDAFPAPPPVREASSDHVDSMKEEKAEETREGGTVTTEMEAVKGLDLQRTVGLLGAISFTVGTMIGASSC